jgi:hypothetical protein
MSPARLAWLGVFGPPAAWAAQFFTGYVIALAACPDNTAGPGWDVPVDALAIILGGLAALATLLCGGGAFLAWRATRENEDDDKPPAGRVHFLSVIGLTITPLFFAIIVMSSAGAIVFRECVQS